MSDIKNFIIEASPIRRVLAVTIVAVLGILLVYLGATTPASLPWKGFLLIFGGVVIWLAERMFTATKSHLVVTEAGVEDSNGEVLAVFDEIKSVSHGTFALKPSNGFTLVLKQKKGPSAWRPGLWWRFGSRVGIGGVTSGHQSKPAAQMIEAMIFERDKTLSR